MNVGTLVGILRVEDQMEEGVRRAMNDAERRFGAGGDAAGDRFVRGADGKIRDTLTGRFAAAGEDAGREFGTQASDGLATEMESGGTSKVTGWLGKLGTLAAGAAIVAGGVLGGAMLGGLTGALKRQQGEGLMQAQLGLTDEQAAAAGRAAANVYGNNFGDSLGGVQEAVGAVWSTLGDSIGPGEDALERATERAITLSQVMGVDVAAAVNTAGIAVKTGLASDATEAFDLMTAASQQMPAEMRGELIPAVDEYGTFLASMGITGQEAFGLLANASKDGAFGIDKTGDALKELGIKATDMSATSVAAYEAAGLNAEDMSARFLAGGESARGALADLVDGLQGIEDPVERSNAAIALFGTPLEDLNVTEIPDFLNTLDTMGAGMEEVAGRTDKAASDISDDAGSKLESFKRKGRLAFDDFIGGKVLPGLENFADRAGPLVDDLLAAWKTDGFSGVADRLGDMWDDAWPRLQAGASALFERGRQWITDNGPRILRGGGELAERFWDWLQDAWPPFARHMASLYGRAANWFAETGVPAVGAWLSDAGPRLWQWVQDAYPSFVRAMSRLWGEVGIWFATTAIPWMAEKGFDLWSALAEWLWTDAAPSLLAGLLSVLGAAAGWITGTGVPWLREKGGEWFGKLVEAAGEKGMELLGWLQSLPGLLGGWITGTALPRLKTAAAEWFDAMVSAAGEKGIALYAWATGLPGQLVDALGGLASMLAAPFIEAFNSIAGAWNSTVGAISFQAPDWMPSIGGKGFDVPDVPTIEGRATGGPVRRGTPYIVGEEGPELVVPDASGTVIPNGRTSSILRDLSRNFDLGAALSSITAGFDAQLRSAMPAATGAGAGAGAGGGGEWSPTILVEVHSQVDSHLDGQRIGSDHAVVRGIATAIEGKSHYSPIYKAIARTARFDNARRG
ncbi:MAG TPA: phage tail tape measure protein [Iamia sp.]|nr:phage tail tape measure protein [Iamia sp.]